MGYISKPSGGNGGGGIAGVSSVNGKTGAVTLTADDVGAADSSVISGIQDQLANLPSGETGLALTELVKSDVVTGDVMIKQLPPQSPIQLKAGLIKAFQYVPDGESAVDVVRTYDNTVAGAFAENDMLAFSSAGTHIKVEFSSSGTEESGIYAFSVDLSAIKEMEIL
jgi:hypothetical protein